MTRLAVLGTGKMGQLVAALAPEAGFDLVAQLGSKETQGAITRRSLGEPDVVIEFTVPTAAARLVRACVAIGLPVVSGTTGGDAERTEVEAMVRGSDGALLWSPNFAIGVHLFAQVVAEASRRFSNANAFTARIVETHHTGKLDAPSGTARMLAGVIARDRTGEVPIQSVRSGQVPGTHEVVFDAPHEQVRLVHEARDRRVFASGALTAARWIVGRRGLFTLDDVLGGTPR